MDFKLYKANEHYCFNFCSFYLWMFGVREDKTWTLRSVLALSFFLIDLAAWSYTYMIITDGNTSNALHHISLNLLATGIFIFYTLQRDDILTIARRVDACFTSHDPGTKKLFNEIQTKYITSRFRIYTDFFTILILLVWGNILLENYFKYLFVQKIEPPLGMKIPIDSEYWACLMHCTETIFVIQASLIDMMVAQIFMVFSLVLQTNLELLSILFSNLKKVNSNLDKVEDSEIVPDVREIAKHHQEIFRTHSLIEKFYKRIFIISYVGMMSCLATCRTLLLSDVGFLNIFMVYGLEMGYIHLFCIFGDHLIVKSDAIRFSAYSTDWLFYPKSVCSCFNIIVTRASKPPRIAFFPGGSDASCETFTMILNASLTFFVMSIILGHKY